MNRNKAICIKDRFRILLERVLLLFRGFFFFSLVLFTFPQNGHDIFDSTVQKYANNIDKKKTINFMKAQTNFFFSPFSMENFNWFYATQSKLLIWFKTFYFRRCDNFMDRRKKGLKLSKWSKIFISSTLQFPVNFIYKTISLLEHLKSYRNCEWNLNLVSRKFLLEITVKVMNVTLV